MIHQRYALTRVVTPASSMALVSLAQAKAALGVTDNAQDAAIQQQIDAVSAAINNYCARIFVVQGYQDRLRWVVNYLNPGDPIRTLQKPIVLEPDGTPIVSVIEDNTTLDPTLWEVAPDQGALYRLNDLADVGAWIGRNIVINYDAGFNPIPPDVQGAAIDWLRVRWFTAQRDPALRSETANDIASFSYFDWATSGSVADGGAPPNAAKLLRPYQIIAI